MAVSEYGARLAVDESSPLIHLLRRRPFDITVLHHLPTSRATDSEHLRVLATSDEVGVFDLECYPIFQAFGADVDQMLTVRGRVVIRERPGDFFAVATDARILVLRHLTALGSARHGW